MIKKPFADDLIEALLAIKWWDWSLEKIFTNLEILCSGDLQKVKAIQ